MIELVAARFRALGEPQRLRIVQLLEAEGELSVNEVAATMDVRQSTVSRHLDSLYRAGIAGRRREGTSVIYSIADPAILDICATVCRSAENGIRADVSALRSSTGRRRE